MNQPIISVCIPVFNSELYIEKTLKSIINQTYKNIEIIVSDNASTDNTVEIVKQIMLVDSRIILNINNENLGFSGNLNKLISLSKSEYISIYHADDIYHNRIVQEQYEYLCEQPNLAGCFTLGKMIDSRGKLIRNKFLFNEDNLRENLVIDHDMYIKAILNYGGSIFICPTAMIKSSVYLEVGNYNTTLNYIEDQDMYLRILEKYQMGIISKELIYYRIHEGQGSSIYIKRTEAIPIPIKHIYSYLKDRNNLIIKYENMLDITIAKCYLSYATHQIKFLSKEQLKNTIEQSKKHYIFSKTEKQWILQNLNISILISLLYIYNISKTALKIALKKLRCI